MERKQISKKQLFFFTEEINYQKENGILSEEQAENILDMYEAREAISFVKILLALGALLIGLGILSFVAGNWAVLGKGIKFFLLLFLLVLTNISAIKLENNYTKTARSLTYVGIFIYGASIFLVGQMFNFGGHFTSAFLLWAVGIVPIAIFYKDKLIYIFIHILMIVYLNGFINMNGMPWLIIIIVAALYYGKRYFESSQLIVFFNNLILLNAIGFFVFKWQHFRGVSYIILFAIGLAMYFIQVKENKQIFKIQGVITFGVFALFLTSRESWDFLKGGVQLAASIVFTIVYLGFLLSILRKSSLTALVFFCLTIFRFYFDTMYDFLPKSMFFIIGGLLLLGFGFYFERMIRVKGGFISADRE